MLTLVAFVLCMLAAARAAPLASVLLNMDGRLTSEEVTLAVNAVLGQTADVEVLVVATENCDVIKSAPNAASSDDKVKVFCKDASKSSLWNKALQSARGEFVALWQAKSAFPAERLALQISFTKASQADGCTLQYSYLARTSSSANEAPAALEYFKIERASEFGGAFDTLVFKRSLLAKLPRAFPPHSPSLSDAAFTFMQRAQQSGKSVALSQVMGDLDWCFGSAGGERAVSAFEAQHALIAQTKKVKLPLLCCAK